jgi:hypothetical protein
MIFLIPSLRIAVVTLLLFGAFPIYAATIVSDKTKSGRAFIVISGPIESDDARKFALELIK